MKSMASNVENKYLYIIGGGEGGPKGQTKRLGKEMVGKFRS
jgi:hypothetical protein